MAGNLDSNGNLNDKDKDIDKNVKRDEHSMINFSNVAGTYDVEGETDNLSKIWVDIKVSSDKHFFFY